MKITEEMKASRKKRIEEAVRKQNEAIREAVKNGRDSTLVLCYETESSGDLYPEIKDIFELAGYTIRPYGYSGGVWQREMVISW